MFGHVKDLQFEAKPDGPDAAFARRLQEILGGKWGEMTVANQYLYQGWNCRLPGKYKDLLLDVGTEEMGHVEMIATMITRLLENAPLSLQEAADDNPMVAAIYGGSNPAHFIHGGGGALPTDSNGVPWNAAFITASGNLMADFHLNVTAEAQGRLQVARLFNMTDDPGVKQMLRFLLARDTMHQNMWMAAIEQLKQDGLEEMPVPDAFTDSKEFTHAPEPVLAPGDPRLYDTTPDLADDLLDDDAM
ncbi:manganese catalase family protein [Micromonospora sp. U21]|uniref:manganese catalase family protein n=1 Tax=Micromonospora sp. U21 TaxID=2824899 RepID=UPI001B35FE31|nr:manganese catalase family protein [Micromonospora sp. U21]MBQ0901197.1 manganese catalase family protein [Micromonospora sp. U21]